MIIATAGHVDHGKTLLVKALTGIDTDRLPEEKKRNLTIDLGFAYHPVDEHRTIGFIDVPGHERFVRNALCGLAGTDFVLFVIAADDGPMPQTREHLAIIDLMGISRGAIALTKVDRVAPERMEEVRSEIAVLFASTTMRGAPIFPVSALSGQGIPQLAEHLAIAARETPPRTPRGNFRLPIDRAFDVVGAGFVVTGTVFSGLVRVGDQVQIAGRDMRLRVRGIHAQNADAEQGVAGQRCALNLTGSDLRKSMIERGDWVVAAGCPDPVRKFDARVRVLPGLAGGLAHWTPVHVHVGAADATGRVAVLEGERIEPGGNALVQISLEHPIGAVHGDRLILRDQSARFTIGGGHIVDIFPPLRGRSKPERVAWLRAMALAAPAEALSALLANSSSGIDLGVFAANRNLTSSEMAEIETAIAMQVIASGSTRIAFSHKSWKRLCANVIARMKSWHEANPGVPGIGETEILRDTEIRLDRDVAGAIAGELVHQGLLVRNEHGVRLPDHKATLQPADAAMWTRVEVVLRDGGLRPMTLREISEAARIPPRQLESFLLRVGRHGLIVRISENRYTTPAAVRDLALMFEDLSREAPDGIVSVASFRDRSEIGRNMAIEILEYFDKRRFTQRKQDGREVLQTADKVFVRG